MQKLEELFTKFPGIGPRQAKRFVYFLAGQDEEFLKSFIDSVSKSRESFKQCSSCFRFFSNSSDLSDVACPTSMCKVCGSLNRDNSLLMLVEKDVDLDNIEKTGSYNGKYFVLGGAIPLTIRQGRDKTEKENGLRFRALFDKAEKEKPKEVILALSATTEGENTARYAEKILEPLAEKFKIKISRLGRGLSTGAELEYIDSETMSNALEGRK